MVLLLARTHYSLLTAPTAPHELCEEAVLRGHDHLVLVDGNGLYGLWRFAQEAARLHLRAVFGCELVCGNQRVVVLAKDQRGYASLCELLSRRQLEADFDLPRAVARHHAGLWVICGDLALLPQLAVRVPREQLLVALAPSGGVPAPSGGVPAPSGGVAAPSGGVPAPSGVAAPSGGVAAPSGGDSASDSASDSAVRKAPDPGPQWPRHEVIEAALALDLDLVAVHDVWFAKPADHALHSLFMAVKWNRALRGAATADAITAALHGHRQAPAWAHLPARGTLHHGHLDHPAAIAKAEAVLASCSLSFGKHAPVFPHYAVPEGNSPASFLRQVAHAGLAVCMPMAGDAVRERLDRELAVIETMGFAPYFLVVHEIAELARVRGIDFVGRGSAADSLVAYALGLTDADPIRYGLMFERFLNERRSELPDIDLDFCWRRRDELIEAVYEHFGRDRVAMISTYNTCGPRSAYAEAAKVAGLPPNEVTRRSQLLPWHGGEGLDLCAVAQSTAGFWQRAMLSDTRELEVLALAQQLLAAPRHLGVHPGGVVMTPGKVAQFVPLERSAKGVVVAQYDKRALEGLGLVKIDLLGNRALTIVRECLQLLQQQGIAVPDLKQIAEDDAATATLLRSGGTLGCFQVESPAMRALLQQLDAATMDRVIQAVALVRPGPAGAGMKDAFVARARGLEPVTAAHPLLCTVFADTFGIMLYQEDVIRAAMAVAGMDGGQGDELRRRLGKRDGDTARDLDAFVVAGLKHGMPRVALEQVWAEMARFSGYSFCKAHAVTYGRLAYRCVWLKARWPTAFLAAVLNNDAGYFDKGVYVEEAKRLGARFLPPCINTGELGFSLLDATSIRVGLREVRGLSLRTQQAILSARRLGGPFRSFDDFLQRVRPQRDEAEHLICVGALDAVCRSRRELLWRLSVAYSPRMQQQRAAAAAPQALFAEVFLPSAVRYPDLPDHDLSERTRYELDLLGYAIFDHPVDVLWRGAGAPSRSGVVPCGRVRDFLGRAIAVHGFVVARRSHRGSAVKDGGEPMLFVTLEDGTGIIEATLFPKVYQLCGGELKGRGPYLVRGVAEERLGGLGLRVTSVQAWSPI
jgi:DNA-directed DNA polymerase III PolC